MACPRRFHLGKRGLDESKLTRMRDQSIDVGHALELMLYDDNTAGQTFELYGPKNYSTEEIAEMVDREIYKKRRHLNVPKAILEPAAGLLNRLLWWPILSAEDVQKEFIDQKIDETAKTFADLGITPGDISNYTYHYLVRFPLFAFSRPKTVQRDD